MASLKKTRESHALKMKNKKYWILKRHGKDLDKWVLDNPQQHYYFYLGLITGILPGLSKGLWLSRYSVLASVPLCFLSAFVPSYIRAVCPMYTCTCYGNWDLSWDSRHWDDSKVGSIYSYKSFSFWVCSFSSLAQARKCRRKKKKKLKGDGGGDGVYFCYLFDLECEFAFIFNAVVLSSNATNNNLDESKGGKHYYYVFVFLAQRRICVGGGRQRENSVYAHPQMESPPKLKYLKSSLWLEAVCV